jgi:hypothetical protein
MTKRIPTCDEVAGMYWWNSMSEPERSAVMQLAKASSVAEAGDWQHRLLKRVEGNGTPASQTDRLGQCGGRLRAAAGDRWARDFLGSVRTDAHGFRGVEFKLEIRDRSEEI